MIILLGKMEIGKKMSKRRDSDELRLNDAQSKEFLGMKYAPGVMHHKTKTRGNKKEKRFINIKA